jgi:hypothetical protein
MQVINVDSTSLRAKSMSTLKYYQLSSVIPPHAVYLQQTAARMLQLEKFHTISQEYILPIPYLCQIYHLLNLKHLEQVHHLSLKGLKVGNVSKFERTNSGGKIEFKTTLNRPLNILRIWRQSEVKVELTLHTPYTIELTVPIYRDCQISIIFNVLPLGANAHKLFIDIYSDLKFPKPILQVFLHCASCLTLFEDLPYLQRLAQGNFHRRFQSLGSAKRDTMQLFERYVDLYGSSLEQSPPAIGAIELRPRSRSQVAA